MCLGIVCGCVARFVHKCDIIPNITGGVEYDFKTAGNFFAYELTGANKDDVLGGISQALMNSQVDLQPHQVDAAAFALRGGQTVQILLCDKCLYKMIKEEFALDKLPEKDMYYKGKFKNKYFKQGCFDRDGTRQEQFMYGTYAESHIQEMDYGNRRQGQSVNFKLFDV